MYERLPRRTCACYSGKTQIMEEKEDGTRVRLTKMIIDVHVIMVFIYESYFQWWRRGAEKCFDCICT